jgi:aspartyl-tRNA(Asn)/glutamyl-tRNA(Gln) amidotransferase subunit B
MSTPSAPYTIIIGLEVHVQLLTKSKLFCGCSTKFGLPPNAATCPICIGMPGVLPVMNRQAFELALKTALALNCQIAAHTKWDRKNYYYPDLPKNYQISQYDLPFSHDGFLEIETASGPKKVGIIRVHLEEDAGKMLHDESGRGQNSMVDLNRAGTPLCEIVSKPDMRTPEEAKAYLEELRLLLRELKVSDCEMQEGSLRVDANVNVHVLKDGQKIAATPIVEIKNLNSFRAVEKAILYEAQRQYEDFQKSGITMEDGEKATAGWDDARGETIIQRRKEKASDYRYFPEPDLVPVDVSPYWIEGVKASMGELPAERRKRFASQYGLSEYDARTTISRGMAFADYFEETAKLSGDAKAASNWCNNQIMAVLNEKGGWIDTFTLRPQALADLIGQIKQFNINAPRAREVFGKMVETGRPAADLVKEMGLNATMDGSQVLTLVQKAIASNPKAAADVKAGKTKAMDALVGFVMRETKGKAPTDEVRRLMQEELAKG